MSIAYRARRTMKHVWRGWFPARTLDKALERLARDLRDGDVPRERFRMDMWADVNPLNWCQTACCIKGHLDIRHGRTRVGAWLREAEHERVWRLVAPEGPYLAALVTRDRLAAADAIANYRTRPGHPWEGVDLHQESENA